MDLLVILPVLALFFYCSFWTFSAIRVGRVFQNPLAIPIAFWTLGYPVRYALILAKPDIFSESELAMSSSFGVEDFFAALLFASAFIAAIGLGLRIMLPSSKRALSAVTFETLRFTVQDRLLVHFIFLVFATASGYMYVVYGISGLYDDYSQLQKNVAEVILGEIANLKWFVAALCLLAYFKSYRRIFIIEALLIFLSIFFVSLLTTSKGGILNFIIYILLLLAVIGKNPSKGVLIAIFCLGLLFSVVSYEMREVAYYNIRETTSQLSILSHYGDLGLNIDSLKFLFEKNIFTLIDRVSYYGDALVLMSNQDVRDGTDLYMYGSLVEIGNLIPRILWEDRPHLSFNHHVTGAVWGMKMLLSETPIGRVGEAYYVGGWLGFLVGFAYALMFALLCRLWVAVRGNLWGVATWCGLFMAWVVPDAYFTYGLKQVLVIGSTGYGLYFLSTLVLSPSNFASK
jgi:hypothetical protein